MKHYFTLLELIVVMTIMFLTVSMGVAIFKGASPARKLENVSLEWQDFCARVRYQALESGSEREIVFDPEKKVFRMRIPETDHPKGSSEEPESSAVLPEWKLPEGFELGNDFPDPNEQPDADNCYLMFRFYSDGGASGKRKLMLKTGELSKSFEISMLTGRLLVQDEKDEKQ